MTNYPLAERKLIYRVLHRHLADHPALMDSQLLHELQTDLQKAAQADGVDVTDHGAWDSWLGNEEVGCDVRVARRFLIE